MGFVCFDWLCYWLFAVGFGCCGFSCCGLVLGVFWWFCGLVRLLVLWFYGVGCWRSAACVSLAASWRLLGVFSLLVASWRWMFVLV